ncbi:hypothetical protein QQX13_06650 [Demequina sp. SYSU T00068]|uniref:hypothetical protein n=1 Tax=Demequina lignilytica TaxID=3051663 RepID=UPI0026373395|nr:hypothetical protein [Demequina sp. SYSU T00068]MDN4490510.1 hypothetical protein [Demequina sp. SYSU T00068]
MGLGARTITVLACATWAIAACASATEPVATASPTEPVIASPMPSATPTLVVYEGRNPDMTDDEAVARAAHPGTGEVWLDEPVKVEPPAGLDLAYRENASWYHVGDRGSTEILVMDDFVLNAVVEVDDDGALSEVTSPWPHADAVAEPSIPLPVSDVYYDSLALPRTWTSPDGVTLELRPDHMLSWDSPSESWGPLAASARVATAEVVRLTDGGSGWAVMAAGPLDPATVTVLESVVPGRVEDVSYGLRLPLGFVVHLVMDPFTGMRPDAGSDSTGYTSLLDQACGDTPDWRSFGSDEDTSDWELVDPGDEVPLYRALDSNPLVQAFHAARVDMAEHGFVEASDANVSVADFAALPAIIGTPAPDGSGWWIEIRSDLSLRYGC